MKAKLVIEMPYNCWECQFRRPTISGFSYLCVANEKVLPDCYNSASKTKPDWCPLEPVKQLKSAYTVDFCIPKPHPRGLRENITNQLFYDLGMQLVNYLEIEEKRIPIILDRVRAIDFDKPDMSMSDYYHTEYSVTLNL